MKLVIERSALIKSLGHVQSVVERRNAIAILSNVLIEADGGNLELSTTDMDVGITDKVAADISADGATTAPVHTLYDIVRKLPDGAQVELETEDASRMVLRAGRSTFNISCLPKEDFPAHQEADLPHSFTLPAAELRTLIDRTHFAISTEETRYYLNGIYLHTAETDGVQVLRAVATDGHRLARIQMPMPEGAAGMPGVIVPRKAVAELRKLADESTDPIEIALSDARIRFTFDSVVLNSKLIDGTFPDYQRVIPADNDKILEVDCAEFTKAVDRVSTISTEKSRAIKLALDDGTLVLSASSPEAGTATEELEVSYGNDAMEIGFNSRYLLDITQQIEGNGAKLTLADAASPTIIQDASDTSALYVLMPMRV